MRFEFDPAKSAANHSKHGIEIWSAFFTYRGDAIRIISVRRARHDE